MPALKGREYLLPVEIYQTSAPRAAPCPLHHAPGHRLRVSSLWRRYTKDNSRTSCSVVRLTSRAGFPTNTPFTQAILTTTIRAVRVIFGTRRARERAGRAPKAGKRGDVCM